MNRPEFWYARPTHYWHQTGRIDPTFSFARVYEESGFDGLLFFDTQNLAPECYVSLAAAASQTKYIQLGTGVTNPMTRHAAVTASAMASLQVVSEGRAYLGIGRGDSSLAHLGYSPSSVDTFEEYLQKLQLYLKGREVEFDKDSNVDLLNLGDQPESSRIQWLSDSPKVPVGVAATGPKVISVAAQHADRIDLMLGASAKRVKWGVGLSMDARKHHGTEQHGAISAYVNIVVHDDGEAAWKMALPSIASQARFAAMHGKPIGPVSEETRQILSKIHASYNMKKHGQEGNGFITSAFAHEFGIYGPPSYCVDRLTELTELGIDRFIVIGSPDLAAPEEPVAKMAERFTTEVLPRLR
jgi:5,10-methylenetetrahydromethanopterin reductase